jgi:trehalose synthase
MQRVSEVYIHPKPAARFAAVMGPDSVEEIEALAADLRRRLGRRVIWNVNSTSAGGGVAEMLHTLLAYARGLGVDARWLVASGEPDFFRLTKRLHNALHGERGDGSPLDARARETFDAVSRANAAELCQLVGAGDVVILHDPPTAGLIPALVEHGARVIWRCHIGSDQPNDEGNRAWTFLAPYLRRAHAFVFSRFAYVPEFCDHARTMIVAPSIDPFSPKNQELDGAAVLSILTHLGVLGGPGSGPRLFQAEDGTRRSVERQAEVLRHGEPPRPDTPLVVQVSRWDRLKDPLGVLNGFVHSLGGAEDLGAWLVLAGPDVRAASDDPEGAEVFDELAAHWRVLPPARRSRIQLVSLPMDDLQENAAMVNALQRHAAVVVQKSLREGFGLTVTEAMWKARPVIASAVGGIQDQIEHGVNGLLLRNASSLDVFAAMVNQLLDRRDFAERLGRNARRRVCQRYLGLRSLTHYADLIERLENEASPS